MINDASRKTHEERKHARRIKMQEGRHKKTSLEKYSPLTLLQGFERLACERMLETKHKLHILTPLLWPSRCVFIVLLMFNQRPWGPLHRGFSESPLGRVWPSLPHLVSTVWNSTGNCIRGFRGPPRSGVAFPTTSRLYCLDVCWQLHRGFPRSPSVGCGLPYHILSLTLWESAGNCSGTQTQLS